MSEDRNTFRVQSSALSDRGLNERRPLNEDSFLHDQARGIFAVADGVGGAEAGEVASQTAIEVLDEAFRYQTDGADVEDLMELAIQRANASIHQMAQEHAKFSMMATTIVALHVKENVATFGHVGDSRLYVLREGRLTRMTRDHTMAQELVDAGLLDAGDVGSHPAGHVLTQVVGRGDADFDLRLVRLQQGDRLLLTTDGLTDVLSDDDIQRLAASSDCNACCNALIDRALEAGATDNVTALVADVELRS